ncbi:hypothetical protein [Peterkaempfera bronchialis]|uniref:hypothetical protein n=1 Tax=Peterkaempfera bronchialis TaxID=2126346 RepID=UPI0013B3D335|nr:hypothetical protein [Peterkaempfera bronchialis]
MSSDQRHAAYHRLSLRGHRLSGTARALELLWTGDFIEAEEALRLGLVSRLYEDDLLLAETLAFARRLAVGPRWRWPRSNAPSTRACAPTTCAPAWI